MNGNDIPKVEGPDPEIGRPDAQGSRSAARPGDAAEAAAAAMMQAPPGGAMIVDQEAAAPLLPDLLHPIGREIASFVRASIAFCSRRAELVSAGIILLAIISGLVTCWRMQAISIENPTQFFVHSAQHDASPGPKAGASARVDRGTPSLSLFDDSALFLRVDAGQSDVSEAFVGAVAQLLAESARDPDDSAIAGLFAYHLDPFFRRNGLLFQPNTGLESTLADISQIAPFIRKLRQEDDIDFFFQKLAETVEDFDTASLASENTNALLLATSDFVEGELRGQRQPFAWNDLLWHRDKWQAHSQFLAVWPVARDKATILRASRTIDAAVNKVRAQARFANVTTDTLNPRLQSYKSDEVFWRALSWWAGLAGLGLILWTLFALRQIALRAILVALSLVTISVTLGIAAIVWGRPNLISWLTAPGLLAFMIPLWSIGLVSLRRGLAGGGSERETRRTIFGDMILRDGRFILVYSALGMVVASLSALLAGDALRVWAGTLAIGILVALIVGLFLGAALFAWRDWPTRTDETEAGPRDEMRIKEPSPTRHHGAWNHDIRRRLGFPLLGLACLGFVATPWIRFDRENPLNVSLPLTSITSRSLFSGLPFLSFPDPRLSGIGIEIRATSEKKASEIVAALEKQADIRSVFWAGHFVPEQISEKLELIDATAQGLVSAPLGSAEPPELSARSGAVTPGEGPRNSPPEDDRQPDSGLRFLRDSLLSVASDGANQLRTSLDRYVSARNADPQFADHVGQDLFAFWPAHQLRLANWLKPDAQIRFQDLPVTLQKSLIGLDPRTRAPFWRIYVYPRANMDVRADRDSFLKAILASYPQARGPLLDTMRARQAARQRLIWWGGLVLAGLIGAGMLLGQKLRSMLAYLAAGLVWIGLVSGLIWLLRLAVDPWLEAFIFLSGLTWISASGVAIWNQHVMAGASGLTTAPNSKYSARTRAIALCAPLLLSLLWGGWVIAPLDAFSHLGLLALFMGPLAVLSLWVVIPQVERLFSPRAIPIEA